VIEIPIHTYQATVNSVVSDTVKQSNIRLSYVVQVPTGENTIYQINHSGNTSDDGAILTAGERLAFNWRDDGYEVVNNACRFLTISSSSDIRVIEVLAKSRADFIRITGTER